MIESISNAKLSITAVLAALTTLWGWFGWLVVFWVGCMAADYIIGTAVACKSGGWKSEIAISGAWKKAGCILSVLVSAAADYMIGMIINHIPQIVLPFSYTVFICPLVLVWYSVTEMGSIVENIGKTGAPIPNFLKKIIGMFEDGVNAAGDKITNGHEK